MPPSITRISALPVEPSRRLKVERNYVFRALAVECAADRKEHGGRTLHGVAYLLLLRLSFLDTLPQRLERSVVVDEAFADGNRIQRLLLVAFARFEPRQRLDGPHEGVRRGAAAFAVKNGVVEPGARSRLVSGRKRNRPGMIVPEDPEPFRALQILDLRQRLLRPALAELGPGGKQRTHQPVEIVRTIVVQELLRVAVFALADRFDRADHRGDPFDGGIRFQLFGDLGAFIELAAHQQRDHQPLLDIVIAGLEPECGTIELGCRSKVAIDVRRARRKECAGKGVDAPDVERLGVFDRRLLLGKGLLVAAHRCKNQHCHAAEKAKECILPHIKPFIADGTLRGATAGWPGADWKSGASLQE